MRYNHNLFALKVNSWSKLWIRLRITHCDNSSHSNSLYAAKLKFLSFPTCEVNNFTIGSSMIFVGGNYFRKPIYFLFQQEELRWGFAKSGLGDIIRQKAVEEITKPPLILSEDRSKKEKVKKRTRSVLNYFHKMVKRDPKTDRKSLNYGSNSVNLGKSYKN